MTEAERKAWNAAIEAAARAAESLAGDDLNDGNYSHPYDRGYVKALRQSSRAIRSLAKPEAE